MIRITDLNVSYGKKKVLNNISLNMPLGQVHGIAGLNGAGKTTLLDTIYGFIRAGSGQITLNNAPLSRQMMGYLESSNYFYPDITGREYLDLFKAGKLFNFDEWITLTALDPDQLISNYSTGMKKKLALLAILKLERQIIIMDEPFNGLDLESVQLLGIIIETLRERGRTIIITSHILETLTRHCDQLAWLKDGRIDRVIAKEHMQQAEEVIFSEYNAKARVSVAGMIS